MIGVTICVYLIVATVYINLSSDEILGSENTNQFHYSSYHGFHGKVEDNAPECFSCRSQFRLWIHNTVNIYIYKYIYIYIYIYIPSITTSPVDGVKLIWLYISLQDSLYGLMIADLQSAWNQWLSRNVTCDLLPCIYKYIYIYSC